MFLPKGSYRFNNGCFERVRQWPRKVRIGISSLFIAGSLTIVGNLPYTEQVANTLVEESVGVHHKVADYISKSNPELPQADVREVVSSTYKMSQKFGVDEKLILAVAKVESNFQPHAISPTGAFGIMQVIPSWHREKIVAARNKLGNPEIFNIKTNMYLGTWVLSDCLDKHGGRTSKALLCYSGQTPGYDKKVLAEYKKI